MDNRKIIIYQIFTRLFGNRCQTRKEFGTLAENGCGKLFFFDNTILQNIRALGVTHVWYTGIIRHATTTDYSLYGIPSQSPAIVKGKAGSPYAIADYYDIDPDLVDNVDFRMQEFEALVARTHDNGMKVIIDFIPNHVARQYKSVAKPTGVSDLGENDNVGMGFSPQNNFYYCVNTPFEPTFESSVDGVGYVEYPAKATGNDHFDNRPGINDWYETVKLNYGVDYCNAGGRSTHFYPVPDTWHKMKDILLFWASKGVDGFRCDMAEMVPPQFWEWAIAIVKKEFPTVLFVAEVYNPSEYRRYILAGFDYLYDKVGMYDTIRSVICGNCHASSLTEAWQRVDDIHEHMLYFLENHDEQRVASDFFAGDGFRAFPGLVANVLMRENPFMVYAGQEFGERGMDKEGFSGCDGRTTIFDYWTVDSLYRGYVDIKEQLADEKELRNMYSSVLNIAISEKAIGEGDFFDLMYVNPDLAESQYAFIRKYHDEVMIVIVNFSGEEVDVRLNIPEHAFDLLQISRQTVKAKEMLSGKIASFILTADKVLNMTVPAYGANIYKFNVKMEYDYVLNEHNKDEYPPAHTAEHLLNQTMVRMFGCKRSTNAHVERKKSKITYILDHKPNRKEEKAIEERMNELIVADLPVKYEYVDRGNMPKGIDASKLPDSVSNTIRIVRIGDYDVCACIGKHVRSTSQIGRFELLGTNWDEEKHSFRIRFKVV